MRCNHPLRTIRAIANDALAALTADFDALYSQFGRPSIPPEQLLRAMLLQAFYGIRSERQLMERIEFDLLFRWFTGLGVDDPVWDHSTFSKNRDRLLEGEIAAQRVCGMALGYEDIIDHDTLRFDPALKLLASPGTEYPGTPAPLAGKSTLSRLEQSWETGNRRYHQMVPNLKSLSNLFVALFLDACDTPPARIALDIDATDVETHGRQENAFFHGYYEHRCLSGRALARAPVGGGFPAPPFRLRGGFTVPPLATFPAAPPEIPDIGFSPVRLQASGTSQFGVEPSADASGLRPTQPFS